MDYRDPCWEIDDAEHQAGLQRQYDLEISEQHPLWRAGGYIVGKHGGNDDVLVQLADGRFAIVHLTWTNTPGDARWPDVTFYASEAEVSRAIAIKAEDYDP